jgi:hypothetical protein
LKIGGFVSLRPPIFSTTFCPLPSIPQNFAIKDESNALVYSGVRLRQLEWNIDNQPSIDGKSVGKSGGKIDQREKIDRNSKPVRLYIAATGNPKSRIVVK